MSIRVECVGGGHTYVAHGDQLVLLAFTEEVGWWRNSVGLTPTAARDLAADLVRQAEASEDIEESA